MIVSHFHIHNDRYRQVVKDYMLLATNLSPKTYEFAIELESRSPNLERHSFHSVESDSSYHFVPIVPNGAFRYRGRYRFPVYPGQTVRIRLLPFAHGPGSDAPDFEGIGHLSLRIPSVRSLFGGVASQGDDPVPVLLHPFTADWALASGKRDYHPLGVATGKAQNDILPDRGSWIRGDRLPTFTADSIRPWLAANPFAAQEVLDDEAATLAGFLAATGGAACQKDWLDALNRVLTEAEIPLEIRRRGTGNGEEQRL